MVLFVFNDYYTDYIEYRSTIITELFLKTDKKFAGREYNFEFINDLPDSALLIDLFI